MASFSARAVIDYIPGYPVLINQQEQTEFASQMACNLLGKTQVMRIWWWAPLIGRG